MSMSRTHARPGAFRIGPGTMLVCVAVGIAVLFGFVLPRCFEGALTGGRILAQAGGGGEEGTGQKIVLEPAPDRPSPADPLDRKVLREADFEYLGAFALPQQACGMSTAWGETGIALRRVDGKLRLITGSHRYSWDALYEVEVPGFGKTEGKWPKAPILREWDKAFHDTYKEKRMIKNGKERAYTHGLYYDQKADRLYFSFGSWFNIPPLNEPSLAYVRLADNKVFGPWKADDRLAHCQKIRGGTTPIPQWFADKYLHGRTLGVGFGGYYSGYSACAMGPFLAACHPPEKEGVNLDVQVLIDHNSAHIAHRNPDYQTKFGGVPNPRNGVGYWGWLDEIFGGGIWIDLPDKHGMLFIATLGHDKTWYEQSDRQAERIESWWFMYDPRDLAAVARGQKRPWDPEPGSWMIHLTPHPFGNAKPAPHFRTPGGAFDPTTRILYVLQPFSYLNGVEWFPLVHGWRVK
jgi:hypothetical protein